VPTDNRLRLHDDQDFGPAGPSAAEDRPEEPVAGVECWSGPLSFEHGYLLSQGEDFKGEVAATTEKDAHGGEQGEEEFQHEPTLLPWRAAARTGRQPQNRELLISQIHGFGCAQGVISMSNAKMDCEL
jgi:hypothetical protein